MLKAISKVSLFAFLVISLTACAAKPRPVLNYNQQGIPSGLTTKQVQQSIQTAGQLRGWTMTSVKPGLMQGSIDSHGHYASITIPYDDNFYSINYKDSYGLKYNGTTIHRNYNKWIATLNQEIQTQLNATKVRS